MAGGGPVTGFLAARAAAAAALLARHRVAVVAVEGGGGGERGGIADVPLPRDRRATLGGVEVEVEVTGWKPSGRSLGVAWRSLSPSLKVTSVEKAEKPN